MNRFAALVLALVGTSSVAHAGVEIGGTVGVHIFSEDNALGSTNDPAFRGQKNTALFGLRLGYYFGNMIGIEAEGGYLPGEARQVLVDVANLTYRGNLVAQFRAANPDNKIIPFVLVGGGAFHVVDSKNTDIVAEDRDGVVYGGFGVKYRTSEGWQVRLDARVLVVPSTDDGHTTDFEGLVSIAREFGRSKGTVTKPVEPPALVDEDADKDGILGAADKCPTDPEDKDSFQDDDGCPDADNDADGIGDATDKCPLEPEDKDSFQDDDGCPDPDNDGDGVPDAADKCIDQPETKNGFEDDDGCPDEIPETLKQFTGVIQGISFKTNSVELAGGSAKTLDKAAAVLAEFKDIKLEIQGHTDDQPIGKRATFPDNTALSQARAEAVKAYFVKKGIDESRLTAKGFGETVPVEDPKGLKGAKLNAARTKNRRVEFKLVGAAEAPAATETPAPTTP